MKVNDIDPKKQGQKTKPQRIPILIIDKEILYPATKCNVFDL